MRRFSTLFADRKSPWGERPNRRKGDPAPDETPASDGSSGDEAPDSAPPPSSPPPTGPRNPWQPAGGSGDEPRRSASIEDIFKNRGKGGGGGGSGGGRGFSGLPRRPDGKSWVPLILAGVAAVWVFMSSYHRIEPAEKAIVIQMGSYSRTLGAGPNWTLPWPLESVIVRDVQNIQRNNIPEGKVEKLILTGDQSLVDLSYQVRWNIKDLKLYEFQLAEPDKAVTEVAEAAMRATIAEYTLDQVFGPARPEIEQKVRQRMQAILDGYRSGVRVQGVEIKDADPPAAVVDAFKGVSAAQQDAETSLSNARAWAAQLLERAQGDATAFDKVYEQYKLSPEVTRRRMYYETMENILSRVDKTIVESGSVTPYLPLPELQRRAAPADAEVTVQGARK